MAKSFNRAIVIGRLGKDPFEEDDVVKFQILQTFTNANGDEEVNTQWIVSKGKQGKLVMENLGKGDLCCIEGTMSSLNKSVTIIAERVTFLSKKSFNNH